MLITSKTRLKACVFGLNFLSHLACGRASDPLALLPVVVPLTVDYGYILVVNHVEKNKDYYQNETLGS